ncbi:MAG: DUF2851 family protein [Verrucomicrobiales bacterium]|nr:DUF2851 family protein [Verrucomicrobiales bacterium]MCP5525795.1 DUF2851 family protein [Verrucomicrobiales bacterium]
MRTLPADLYERWREGRFRPAHCCEPRTPAAPEESVLQQVWRHQRLLRDGLRTVDGQRLTVLHPGFWNREAGPDFRGALLQFDDHPALTGDVEIDLHPAGWSHHRHATNPAYANVLLHVVWQAAPGSPAHLPTLVLADRLDAPLEDIERWLADDSPGGLAPELAGLCSEPLSRLPAPVLAALLEQAARIRLTWKSVRLQARARQAGWTGALWESLFAALGYKHNPWPMRRMAELLPVLAGDRPDLVTLQARLIGVAGLLPRELSRQQAGADAALRRIWDAWWRDQAVFAEWVLPDSAWRLAGVRPANHPQRRLALAAHWLNRGELGDQLEQWLARDIPRGRLVASLQEILSPGEDALWSHHWHLRGPALQQPRRLLGNARVTDLAVNAVLPWLHSRATIGAHDRLRARVESRFNAWPATQDNAELRLARDRLLRDAPMPRPGRAAHQQGLQQILRDFCHQTNARCDGCRFPALVGGIDA